MKKLISISGTHCTGKSTLIEHLKTLPEFENVTFLKSSSKGLSDLGLKINTEGDTLTQLYCACKDFMQIVENRNNEGITICDRSIFDTHIYTLYLYMHKKVAEIGKNIIYDLSQVLNVAAPFDKIFLLRPTFELQNEEERSMDKTFQMEIKELFDQVLEYQIAEGSVGVIEYLPDTLEERVKRITEYINE